MTGQEKGDLLIQVTAWACFTVYVSHKFRGSGGHIGFSLRLKVTTCGQFLTTDISTMFHHNPDSQTVEI